MMEKHVHFFLKMCVSFSALARESWWAVAPWCEYFFVASNIVLYLTDMLLPFKNMKENKNSNIYNIVVIFHSIVDLNVSEEQSC